MIKIHHLNCLKIESPITDNVIGHCLLLEAKDRLVLIDTGIGLLDILQPNKRIGKELIERVGFKFHENLTAIRQIEKLGLNPKLVTDCIISHLDPDHIGGLADFPDAKVHVSEEEYQNFMSGSIRYLPIQLNHNPKIITYQSSNIKWFDFEARRIEIDINIEMFLIPLFGHTFGHCGVAIQDNNNWLLYVGDAYYMRIELTDAVHPVNELASMRADDNILSRESLNKIRKLLEENPNIKIYNYHDVEEFNDFK